MGRSESRRDRDELVGEASEESFPASSPAGYRSAAVGGPELDAAAVEPGAPAGLTYRVDFIPPDEERSLLRDIDHVGFWEVRFHGYRANRNSIPAVRTLRHSITFRSLRNNRALRGGAR